jgi:hypothetical protein
MRQHGRDRLVDSPADLRLLPLQIDKCQRFSCHFVPICGVSAPEHW